MAATERPESAPDLDTVLDRLEVWHRDVPAPSHGDRTDDSRHADR